MQRLIAIAADGAASAGVAAGSLRYKVGRPTAEQFLKDRRAHAASAMRPAHSVAAQTRGEGDSAATFGGLRLRQEVGWAGLSWKLAWDV